MTLEVKEKLEHLRRGIIPEGYQKALLGLAPTAWRKAHVSEICTLSSGSTPRRDNPDNFAGDILWITSGELKKKFLHDTLEKISEKAAATSNLTMYEPGTVVIAIYGLEAAGVRGTISIIKKRSTISQACIAFNDFLNVHSEFFYYWYLNYGQIIGRRFAQGTKQQNLSTDIVGSLSIYFPDIKSQQKIAEILATQDRIIELSQEKLEQLKLLKRACLAKMFPKRSCDRPEVRFPGFSDAWEQRKLGDVGKARSGVGFPDAAQGGLTGIPFFKVSDMNSAGNEHEMNVANNYVSVAQIAAHKWSPIEDVPAIFFAKVGAAVMLNRKRLCRFPFLLDNNTMAYSLDKDKWDSDFAKSIFETIDLTALVQVGALPSYNSGDVESLQIRLPKRDEQQKIGAFFKNLDHLITLQQRKIDELKRQKKALMQLLLTGIVRVDV